MSTTSKRLRQLDEIYAALPSVECKGLCHDSCGAVPVYDAELARLEQAAQRKLPTLELETVPVPGRNVTILARDWPKDGSCPLLVMKRCSQYNDRPLICRIFGVAEGLPCPHGCEPTKKLADQDVITIQRKMEKL